MRQGEWLTKHFDNVRHEIVDLTPVFDDFEKQLSTYNNLLGLANSRSRLRMVTLYQIAQSVQGIVVGTGNKVEDFGVGFYTKYGDGGVDISPIADCYKTEVWQMGRELGVLQEIIDAAPTDGLWDDGRTDQDQLGGLSYAVLELAMKQDNHELPVGDSTQQHNLDSYRAIRSRSLHKMNPIPVFKKS
jgi:NAD+ synthase